ncbi:carboxypeptidase-like regulatory domain-containing protein [Lacinutrix undariae]
MRKTITINITEPCHEDWNTMTPNAKGRHCAVCEKTVTDFTTTTDENIIKTLESNTKLCGRFKNTQLNRTLVLSRKEKNNYLSFVASSLFAFLSLGNQELIAQNHPQTTQNDSLIRPSVKGKIAVSILPEVDIKGTIISNHDSLPIPGVNVMIKGTTIGVQSDFDGNFALKTKPNSTLVLSFIGFETKEIKITKSETLQLNLIEMEEEMLGEVIVVGGYVSISKPQYTYTPEELENKEKLELSTKNYFTFYKKKHHIEREKRKVRRQQIKNGEIARTTVGKLLYKMTNIFRSKQ